MSTRRATRWTLAPITCNPVWKNEHYKINRDAKSRRYAFRMLRYWFMERLLKQHAEALGRSPSVLEIGVDRGQMKAFVDGAADGAGERPPYAQWDAADCAPQHEALERAGYGECAQVNLDEDEGLADLVARHRGRYDVIILLHVLEHLNHPERAMALLSTLLRPGGVIIGGFPVLPSGIARIREWQLKHIARPFGHVSAFSPRRLRKMAKVAGLRVDYASGAFAVRASGSPLENHAWWVKANLAFGHAFPGWPGELYWQLTKPVPRTQTAAARGALPQLAGAD